MLGLDTNVLVRYLTKDDLTQWKKAVEVISDAEACFVSDIVLCELVWVLQSKAYRYSQPEIIVVLEKILQSSKFEFANRTIIYQAIKRTKQGKADFADYLIDATNHSYGCSLTATFDKNSSRIVITRS